MSETTTLHCFDCGEVVSTPVPEETIVRAILTCPECVDKTAPMNPNPTPAKPGELKPCISQACNGERFDNIEVRVVTGVSGQVLFCYARCNRCGCCGPQAEAQVEAERLWNALPRAPAQPTGDSVVVKRADIQAIISTMVKPSTGRAAIQADLEQLLAREGEG
jgi:hypothetical protein